MASQPYTQDDLTKGQEIVLQLHGIKGFDNWAEHIAKALAAARQAETDTFIRWLQTTRTRP